MYQQIHYALKNNLLQEYTWFEPRKFSLEMEIEDFLIENNIIERIGSDKTGYWIVKK